MKGLKKLLTGILAATLALTMNVTALAAEEGNTITVKKAENGETYNIYRLLDLDVTGLDTKDNLKDDGYVYTINEDWKGFWTGEGAGAAYIDTNTVGENTYVVWKAGMKTAEKMEAFGKAAAEYAKGVNPVVANGVKAEDGKAEFTGLANGYYMVTSTLGAAVSIASTPSNPVQTIEEKNQGNTTDKEVKEDSTGEYGKENDAQIGDTIEFRSQVNIAKNSINVKYHDTMTKGLTWTGAANVKVYSDVDLKTEVPAANYTVEEGTAVDNKGNKETFVVSFDNTYVAGFSAATTLYIKYDAVLNDQAVVKTGEINKATITWGNNGKSEEKTTETKTHSFQILKYDGAKGKDSPLAGAKFILWSTKTTPDGKVEKEQLKLAVKKDNDLLYKVYYDAVPEGYKAAADNKIVTVATDKITVEGVDSDKYLLEETDAPLGFTKLEAPVEIEVNADNSLVADVPNLSGLVLPSTGGIGTTIFYILGGILIVAGVAYFMVRRKVNAE